MRVNFTEKKKGHYESDDGRFVMDMDQNKHSHKFFIQDLRTNKKVGAPTSFVKAVSLVRRYLLEERQREENPTTMPRPKIGDNVVPVANSKPTLVPPPSPQIEEKSSTNAQILMVHLAAIADKEGTFTVSRAKLSRAVNLTPVQISYWMKKFIKVEWLIELEPEESGKPGSYGFSLDREEIQSLVQNMPTRIMVEKSLVAQMPEPKPRETSQAGILAGRALVKIAELDTKVENLGKIVVTFREDFDRFVRESNNKEKPGISEFETVLEYLEESQKSINNFMHETFGVSIR